MARASITLRKHDHRRYKKWHAYYRVYDADGRLIFSDDGTASVHWEGFMRAAERDVGVLRFLEARGYRTDKHWHQLVDEAVI